MSDVGGILVAKFLGENAITGTFVFVWDFSGGLKN